MPSKLCNAYNNMGNEPPRVYYVRSGPKASTAIARVRDGGVSKPSTSGRQKGSATSTGNIPWDAIIPHIDAISRTVAPGVGWVDMFLGNDYTVPRTVVMAALNAHTSVPLKLMRDVVNRQGVATMSNKWFKAHAIAKLAQSRRGM